MRLKTKEQAINYMLSKPDSNFVVFTHQDRRWPALSYLIRKAIYLTPRYSARLSEIPSHTGSVWVENGELQFYHSTWPVFKREPFKFRKYNVVCEIACKKRVKFARNKCREMLKKRRGYGVGQLINFAVTIWFTWFSNAVTAGKVCSEAVAVSYPKAVLGGVITDANDIDPYYAMLRIQDSAFKSFTVDRR